ncbi:tyrosine-type recombinase/integrase [Cohnella boryungensis]|uniref:Tyrosine-type recombinase/integrase n=1 Tax=Cohnella boryungensis TaxID=768479 RepID=A0ABV8SFV1_9BACL
MYYSVEYIHRTFQHENQRFHYLRHTHASMMLKRNINSKVIQERLGHSSIIMTFDLYSHLCPNMQREAANILGKALFQNTM